MTVKVRFDKEVREYAKGEKVKDSVLKLTETALAQALENFHRRMIVIEGDTLKKAELAGILAGASARVLNGVLDELIKKRLRDESEDKIEALYATDALGEETFGRKRYEAFRKHFDVEDSFFRWHDDFTDGGVDFGIGYRSGFDKEVRHVLLCNWNFDFCALPLHLDELVFRCASDRQHHSAVWATCIDEKFDAFTWGVGSFVCDEFEVGVGEVSFRHTISSDRKEDGAFDTAAFGVGHLSGEPKLSSFARLEFEFAIFTFCIVSGFDLPAL